MTGNRVYTDPQSPGAPQVGDIVVVEHDWDPSVLPLPTNHANVAGAVARLDELDLRSGLYKWAVSSPGRWAYRPVHAVRWPTQAELAAYQLSSEAP